MIPLYLDRDSPIHRLRPGLKLLALPVLGSALFLLDSLPAALAALGLVSLAAAAARVPPRILAGVLRSTAFILAILFAAQLWISGWEVAILVVLRLGTLILAASLVTLTTRTAEMIDALEWAFAPLARFGFDPAKPSLAISLTLRFVPVVAGIAAEVREAQRARGIERSLFALAVPLVVRTLKMADEIAEAIEARSGR